MTPEEKQKHAEGAYHGAAGVAEYMEEKVKTRLESILGDRSQRETHLFGYFLRALGLMQSVRALNSTQHFQSVVACNRALLEILVDTILVRYDNDGRSDKLLPAWEESAKLKHCTATVEYYKKTRRYIPDALRVRTDFVTNDTARVKATRAKLWPNRRKPTTHPQRWTGRANLLEDIRAADNLHTVHFRFSQSSSLEEYYETEFRELCWNVHGSGFTAIRNTPAETIVGICSFGWLSSADLALECSKLVLLSFGFDKVLDLPDEWKNIEDNRVRILFDLVTKGDTEEPAVAQPIDG